MLWYHENTRVFSDRLINDEDRKWFDELLRNVLMQKFSCDANDVIGKKPLFYGDFCDTTGEYEQITNLKKVIVIYSLIVFISLMIFNVQ